MIPGSHRRGIIWPSRKHTDRRFDCSGETVFPHDDTDAVPVEVKAGSIVFFNGYLLHRSLPNHAASGYRRVLVNHYMSAESLLPWKTPQEGETMGTLDCRDIVMVVATVPPPTRVSSGSSERSCASGGGGCIEAKAKAAGGEISAREPR